MLNRKTGAVAAVAALVCFGVIAGRLTVQAGPLDPPAGPIQPTMHTLDEIYALLELQFAESIGRQWSYEALPDFDSGNEWIEVITGSGVLHSVVVTNNSIQVRDGGGREIGWFVDTDPAVEQILDIHFDNGIEVSSGGLAPCVFRYRVDGASTRPDSDDPKSDHVMPSLETLYEAVSTPFAAWEYATAIGINTTGEWRQLITGSGYLHAILINSGNVEFRDGTGKSFGLFDPNGPNRVNVSAAFEGGLEFRGNALSVIALHRLSAE